MKIKNIIIIILTLIFGVVETWGQTEVTTPLTATTVLQNNTIYKVENTLTITNSTITVAEGATATIYIAKGVTLTITGQAGSGQTGAYPAIGVPEGTTLIITGEGKLIATGGEGGKSTNGLDGTSGYVTTGLGAKQRGGAGGTGGNGGGGAAPAIGGRGGVGGTGGAGGDETDDGTFGSAIKIFQNKGTNGGNGSPGFNMGDVYILGAVNVYATSGSRTETSTNGSNYEGEVPTHDILNLGKTWYYGGSGGQGGNGSPYPAYAIGGGAGGGAGGGGGHSGIITHNSKQTDLFGYAASGTDGSNGGNGTLYVQSTAKVSYTPSRPDVASSFDLPEDIKATLTFKDGETIIETKNVYYGTRMSSVEPLTKAGYTFNGYKYETSIIFDENGNPQSFSEFTPSTTHELYAQWTANTYKVSFKIGGLEVASKDVTFASTYGDLPAPAERTGYSFDGWYTAETGGTKVESSNVVTTADDHTLYAHWTANQYDVTYDANGGEVDGRDEKIIKETYDLQYTCPEPTRYGYDFDGWYTEKNGGTKKEKTARVDITSDMTLYAHWNPKATNFEAYTASGLGGYYFRSFFDSKVAYEMPDKVMAFTAKVDNDYLLLTAIEGNIIPKNTPVILRAEESAIFKENAKNYIKLVTSESGESISAENVLLGTDDDMDSHSDNCYILSHGSKGLGFYKWPTTKTLEAHKAYIEGGSSSAKALIFRFEDEATGINNEIIDSASDESEPVIYNLSGIRISKPQKGINIINGKKVWVPGDR